jgi:hypothetical protein
MQSVEEVGVEWRETNFLRTLRLRTERSANTSEYIVDNSVFGDVTRLALIRGGIAVKEERSANTAHESTSTTKNTAVGTAEASDWRLLPTSSQKSSILGEGLWSLLLEDKAVVEASLLLLNFPILDGLSPGTFQKPVSAWRVLKCEVTPYNVLSLSLAHTHVTYCIYE